MDESPAIVTERLSEEKKLKKVYMRPTFRFERVFETQALACGKIAGHAGICKLNPKTS
jgi:hypothetical protein